MLSFLELFARTQRSSHEFHWLIAIALMRGVGHDVQHVELLEVEGRRMPAEGLLGFMFSCLA